MQSESVFIHGVIFLEYRPDQKTGPQGPVKNTGKRLGVLPLHLAGIDLGADGQAVIDRQGGVGFLQTLDQLA